MKKIYLGLVSLVTALSADASQLLPVAITEIQNYEFDHVSQCHVVEALVVYRDGCYKPFSQEIMVEQAQDQIRLFHLAERKNTSCVMALVPKVIRFEFYERVSSDPIFVDGFTGKTVPILWK